MPPTRSARGIRRGECVARFSRNNDAYVILCFALARLGALIGCCRERRAGFKTPKRIVILERLPKNANGKILQRELRSQDSCTRAP